MNTERRCNPHETTQTVRHHLLGGCAPLQVAHTRGYHAMTPQKNGELDRFDMAVFEALHTHSIFDLCDRAFQVWREYLDAMKRENNPNLTSLNGGR
jgi:hypothetical protein